MLRIIFLFCLSVPCMLHAWLASDIQALAEEAGNLEMLYGGGFNYLYEKDEGCVAVGVGFATATDFEKARKLALVKATSRLTEALNGAEISSRQRLRRSAGGEGTNKEMLSVIEKSVAGALDKVRIRGYWIRDGIFYIVACRYINLPKAVHKDDFAASTESLRLSPAWVASLAYCRDIWLGGVAPVYNAEEDKFYLAAVVSVKDAGAVGADNVLRTAAARDLMKYRSGSDFSEDLKSVKQVFISAGEDGRTRTEHSSKRERESREIASGAIGAVKKVGSFKHKISKRHYALFVTEIR